MVEGFLDIWWYKAGFYLSHFYPLISYVIMVRCNVLNGGNEKKWGEQREIQVRTLKGEAVCGLDGI